MTKLTIEDLKKIREKARGTVVLREGTGRAKVTVHMGTCGIASGARDIMDALMNEIEAKEVSTSTKIWNKLNSLKPILKLSRNDKTMNISLPLAAFIGLSVGILAGLFGVGGGWIQVPIFIIFFGLDPLLASGTSLFIIIIKAVVSSVTYIAADKIPIDWWIILALVIGMSIGALIGNWLKGVIKIKFISYIVGSALIIIVIFTIFSTLL